MLYRVEINKKRFAKAYKKLDLATKRQTDKAIKNFVKNPLSSSLNFELIRTPFYTIRVNKKYRIIVIKKKDEIGDFYSIDDVDNHDSTYRKINNK